MKIEAEQYIKQIAIKQDREQRDELKIEMTRLFSNSADTLVSKGSEAAGAAGSTVQ